MKAVKENKVYTVDENTCKSYQEQGFDIYDDNGDIIEYGSGKMVTYEEYLAVKKELDDLKAGADEQEVVEILKQYATEHNIEIGNSKTVFGIVKKIKEHKPAESGE